MSIFPPRDVANMVAQCISENNHDISIFSSGSSSQGVYLPESDLDLVALFVNDESDEATMELCVTEKLIAILRNLCDRIILDIKGESGSLFLSPPSMTISTFHFTYPVLDHRMVDPKTYKIRNAEYINARTKLVGCQINNIKVDITCNQLGGLASALLIEEADDLIGFNHLLKRSIILVKAWCFHESEQLCGKKIIGAKEGVLSSYALSVLVMSLFNKFPTDLLIHPFAVLRAFLYTYSNAQAWTATSIISLRGIMALSEFRSSSSSVVENKFSKIQLRIQSMIKSVKSLSQNNVLSFQVKHCNIEDPLDFSNNLGLSISRHNLQIIHLALSQGHHQLESLLPWHPHLLDIATIPFESKVGTTCLDYKAICLFHDYWLLRRFFPFCLRMYQPRPGYLRDDMKDHPLQQGNKDIIGTFDETSLTSNIDPWAGNLQASRKRFRVALQRFGRTSPSISPTKISATSKEKCGPTCASQYSSPVARIGYDNESKVTVQTNSSGKDDDDAVQENRMHDFPNLSYHQRIFFTTIFFSVFLAVLSVSLYLRVRFLETTNPFEISNQMNQRDTILQYLPNGTMENLINTCSGCKPETLITFWVRLGESFAIEFDQSASLNNNNDNNIFEVGHQPSLCAENCSSNSDDYQPKLYGWRKNNEDLIVSEFYRLTRHLSYYAVNEVTAIDGGLYQSYVVEPNGTESVLANAVVRISGKAI